MMPTRISVFPIVFGVSLAGLCVAYSYRKSFFSDVWEKHKKESVESRLQAAHFKAEFTEKLEKEKLKRSN